MTRLALPCLVAFGSVFISTHAWLVSHTTRTTQPRGKTAIFNLLDDLLGYNLNADMPPVESMPYGEPILPTLDRKRTIAIQERGISFTGEDFDVTDIPSSTPICRVRGALLHLPGKDAMKLTSAEDGIVHAKLDRKLVAVTPTYDIYRGDEKIAWIEKAVVAFRDTFEVHLESAFHFGPIKPPAAYKLEGDFMDRTFSMRDDKGRVVAVVSKDGFFPQFDAFNHYQVSVAPGMDAGLVVACACAIDEEFDEEHQKKQKEKNASSGGGWF